MLTVNSNGNLAGGLKPLVVASVGADKFSKMKEEIAKRTMDELPGVIHYSYDYTLKALDMERTICKAMKGLSSAEFEGVLHPVFQEDCPPNVPPPLQLRRRPPPPTPQQSNIPSPESQIDFSLLPHHPIS
ncbi:hypothetical protein TrVE_jg3943 [Triparma verrucosa]|uniref:Uncharacterized protein n=1 Tax=Triparma verrucosa TaxID=1606542 RepID=A0A9W7BD91_9STRA|nr:hypothetical protein TrVE_jg3943 [Triparma verrucosa]